MLSTLREFGLIDSSEACVSVIGRGDEVECALDNASVREKNLFADALGEMLSPPDNPRYLLIRRLRTLGISVLLQGQCYACPSVLGVNKERAERFKMHLERNFEQFELVYTRSEEGRKTLLQCRRAVWENGKLRPVRRKRELGKCSDAPHRREGGEG